MKKWLLSFLFLFLLSVSAWAADTAAADLWIDSDEYIFRLCNGGDMVGIIGVEPKDKAITPWIVRAFSLRIDEKAPIETQMVYFTGGTFEYDEKSESYSLRAETSRGGSFTYVPSADPAKRRASAVLSYNVSATLQAEEDVARRMRGLQSAYRNIKAYFLAGGFFVVAGGALVLGRIARKRRSSGAAV